jgi:hypothetical protein
MGFFSFFSFIIIHHRISTKTKWTIKWGQSTIRELSEKKKNVPSHSGWGRRHGEVVFLTLYMWGDGIFLLTLCLCIFTLLTMLHISITICSCHLLCRVLLPLIYADLLYFHLSHLRTLWWWVHSDVTIDCLYLFSLWVALLVFASFFVFFFLIFVVCTWSNVCTLIAFSSIQTKKDVCFIARWISNRPFFHFCAQKKQTQQRPVGWLL